MQCARHPKVETNLRCGRCDTPICPKCSIPGPVGMRCRDCAAQKSSALYQIHPARFALAAVLGLLAGTIVGAVLDYTTGTGFSLWIILFAGPVIGRFVGDLIVRAAGRKRGLPLEILAGVSVVGGAVLAQWLFHGGFGLLSHIERLIVYGVAVILTAALAIERIRNS